eukprot:4074992-Amphidinium_carterae.1
MALSTTTIGQWHCTYRPTLAYVVQSSGAESTNDNCALACQGGVSKYDTQCAQCFRAVCTSVARHSLGYNAQCYVAQCNIGSSVTHAHNANLRV